MADFKPRPENRREFMDKLVKPFDPTVGNPNQIFSKDVLPGMPEHNRSLEISQKGDSEIDVSVGIEDMDTAIKYYFDNVIKLSVYQNNQKKTVPVLYGSPERWKNIQADGYLRDKESKLQVPLVIYKRDSIEQVRDLGNKLDGNSIKNFILVERNYSKSNVYNNFNILTNRVKQKQYIVAFPPDYVTVTYSCIIYTYFAEQMNGLIEAINFASNSYWGDPTKFQFRSKIDTFSTMTAIEAGEDRMVKSEFKIVMNGYIVPDSLNKEAALATRIFSPSQIAFGVELAASTGEYNLEKKNK